MKTILLLFSLLFFTSTTFCQSKKTDSLNLLRVQTITPFLNLHDTDKVVDIGTGAGYSLLPIAAFYKNIVFTVEDIDSNVLNKKKLVKQIANKKSTARIEQFNIVYGTEKTTNLPTKGFNKILLFDVIHELTYKQQMFEEIKRVLLTGGSIFIEEVLVYKPSKKEKWCNYPFFTEVAFKTLLETNNFTLIKEAETFNTGKKKYMKIFEYKLKN